MHQDVLARDEHLHIIPGEHLVFGKGCVVVHYFFMLRTLLLIHKVGDQHIQGILSVHEPAQRI